MTQGFTVLLHMHIRSVTHPIATHVFTNLQPERCLDIIAYLLRVFWLTEETRLVTTKKSSAVFELVDIQSFTREDYGDWVEVQLQTYILSARLQLQARSSTTGQIDDCSVTWVEFASDILPVPLAGSWWYTHFDISFKQWYYKQHCILLYLVGNNDAVPWHITFCQTLVSVRWQCLCIKSLILPRLHSLVQGLSVRRRINFVKTSIHYSITLWLAYILYLFRDLIGLSVMMHSSVSQTSMFYPLTGIAR